MCSIALWSVRRLPTVVQASQVSDLSLWICNDCDKIISDSLLESYEVFVEIYGRQMKNLDDFNSYEHHEESLLP